MFRAIVKQRSNLDLLPIADMQILNASISEDTTQKATSTINVVEVPSNVFLGDLVGVYTSKGIFIYWGTISAINENKITLQQFNSFYNDTHLLVPQTSNNQKTFFNTKTISNVIELYLKSKELGHQSTLNDMSASLVPTYQGLVDKDVANNYKGITHTIIDNEQTFAPYPQEKESKNLETFLYDMFNTYNRIIKPIINLKGGGGTPQKDYYELEYIQSTGTQWIDTGVILTNSTLIKTKFSMLEASGMMFGQDYIFVCNGNNLYTYNNQHNGTLQANKVYDSEIKLYPNEQYFKDGTTTIASSTFASGGYSPQHQVHSILFGRNTASSGISAVNLCKAQIYNFKIYQSDVLVRDFVPCIRKIDLAIGLWDKVSNEFYGNAGTGTFIGGGIVE